jgi:hypothetical protein
MASENRSNVFSNLLSRDRDEAFFNKHLTPGSGQAERPNSDSRVQYRALATMHDSIMIGACRFRLKLQPEIETMFRAREELQRS